MWYDFIAIFLFSMLVCETITVYNGCYLAYIFLSELSHLEETTLGSDLSQGWGLQALVSIIKSFTDIEAIRQRYNSLLIRQHIIAMAVFS